MSQNILVIAAHPDDEILGCGATIAKHIFAGDFVYLLVLADGEKSRKQEDQNEKERGNSLHSAANFLGISKVFKYEFPDNKMDTVPILDITQTIEKIIQEVKPSIIYTHHSGDLNIDHRITYQATMTACRPLPTASVNAIYSFEVVSSSEWALAGTDQFRPVLVCEISAFLEKKMLALQCYKNEMRPFPHARSFEAIEHQAKSRGAQFGVAAAEVFGIERQFWR